MVGCEDITNWQTTDSYKFKQATASKSKDSYYSPLTLWSGRVACVDGSTITATAKAIFEPNANYKTVNFQSSGIDGISYSIHTNTLTSPTNKVAFAIAMGDNNVNIYDNESLTIQYTKPETYSFVRYWVSTNGGVTKTSLSKATALSSTTTSAKDTINLYYRAKTALGATAFNNATSLTFGVEFEAPEYEIHFEKPTYSSYMYTHMRGESVVTSGTKSYDDEEAVTTISGVRPNDVIRLTYVLSSRGCSWTSFYTRTSSNGSKTTYGSVSGQPYRNWTDFTANLWMGANFIAKTQHNITYLVPTYGSYTASGTDKDGFDYPSITPGESTVTTFASDEIALHATIGYGYKLVRWYLEDGNHTKYTIPQKGNKPIADLNTTIYVGETGNNLIRKKGVYDTGVGVPFDKDYSLNAEIVARTNPLTVSFETAEHGTYTASGKDVYGSGAHPSITVGGVAITTYSDDEITLTVTSVDEGYIFQRFYAVVNGQKVTIGAKAKTTQTVTLPAGTTAVSAEFSNLPYTVDGVGIADFGAALQIAQGKIDNGAEIATVVVVKDATVESGYYTIPAGVVLLIPYKDNYFESATLERSASKDVPTGAYRTLTLEDDVHLQVYGTIEVGGLQSSGGGTASGEQGIGCPTGQYGYLHMKGRSSITLNNGAKLYAWGYILGERENGKYLCEIDARRGSEVREQFQIMDWKGGSYTTKMFDGVNSGTAEDAHRVLPVNQYYIQNIEIPVKYRPGAKLSGAGSVAVVLMEGSEATTIQLDNAGIIGAKYADTQDAAIFLMNNEDDSEDTWVRKYYEPTTDQQVYEINNSAYIGSLVLSMGGFSADSREYKLPITNNFKIHLLNGNMEVTQHTEFMAGSEVIVNKKSRMTIPEGVNVYLYDKEDWGRYIYVRSNGMGSGTTVKWIPAIPNVRVAGRPNVRRDAVTDTVKIEDTKFNISGTFDVQGKLFTTSHGASIISNIADAGTVIFSSDAPADFSVSQITNLEMVNSEPVVTYKRIPSTSAQLKNEVGNTIYGEYSTTTGTKAGNSFCFVDMNNDGKGEWVSLVDDGCWAHDQKGVYYIKPRAYVPISAGEPEEKPDHTYRDEYAGTDSIYIQTSDLSGNCQWWCVYPVEGHSDLFECKHKDNHIIYYYDESRDAWIEKKFDVTFKNWNDTTLKFVDKNNFVQDHYELPYNSHPKWLSDNPTRSRDANYTYEFDGWSPEITSSTVVTEDVVFMAKYKATPREYLITFNDQNEDEIESTQYVYGSMPEAPEADLDTYSWSPAIGMVTSNQTYQLVPKPSTYTVTYKNWNGTVLQATSGIASETVTPACSDPTKTADKLYSYEFAGWSPSPAVTVTADAVYTATFNAVAQKYTIKFVKENGDPNTPADVISTQTNVAYGAMPNVPEYSKENPAEYTEYTLVWNPLVSAATQDQVYIANFISAPQQFKVEWKNGDDVLETKYFAYDATPTYSGVTPAKASDANYAYNFSGWSPEYEAVTSDQVYTAQFTQVPLTITVNSQQEINSSVAVQTITVELGGTLTVSQSAIITADDLILQSNGSNNSGQINVVSSANINCTNAYFDLKVSIPTHKWYAVAVPWQVDPTSGISVNGRTLEFGKEFDILYYDGAVRAASGANGSAWKYLEEKPGDQTMQPGTLYMIGLMMDAPQGIRFAKKTGASLLTTTTSVTAYGGTNTDPNHGWNGIANPALFHAFVNAGVTTGQVYNTATNGYGTIELNSQKLVVGQPVFVQVEANKSPITVSYGGAFAAPRRTAKNDIKYDVRIAPENADYTDRLFVRLDEDKADTYVIGQDLAKMGVSSVVPQLWINRYDAKLCMNTQALTNGVAEYPLSIYAPANGEYEISCQPSAVSDQNAVYLTLDGQAIWNLTDGGYTLTLSKGTATNYGLRISARAPQTATGTDEAIIDAKGETRKVLINDKVYIIRGDEVYTVDGRLVK